MPGQVTSVNLGQEARQIRKLLDRLLRCPSMNFPSHRKGVDAPMEPGVYIIYDPKSVVAHVGRTPRGKLGIRQRLKNHLHSSSSFTSQYLKGAGHVLRSGYTFRYIIVKDPRTRALLEAYATGCLCPAHLGSGDMLQSTQR